MKATFRLQGIALLISLLLLLGIGLLGARNYSTSGAWICGGACTIPDSDETTNVTSITVGTPQTTTVTLGGAATTTVNVGGAATTAVALTGDLTASGSVVGQANVVSLATGALTLNTVHLATASSDYDIPDGACDAAADVGNWVTVVLEDDDTDISITSDDASNVIYVPGLDLGAGDELDNVKTAAHEGANITLTCLAAEGWYMTAGNLTLGDGSAIAWADGGAAD